MWVRSCSARAPATGLACARAHAHSGIAYPAIRKQERVKEFDFDIIYLDRRDRPRDSGDRTNNSADRDAGARLRFTQFSAAFRATRFHRGGIRGPRSTQDKSIRRAKRRFLWSPVSIVARPAVDRNRLPREPERSAAPPAGDTLRGIFRVFWEFESLAPFSTSFFRPSSRRFFPWQRSRYSYSMIPASTARGGWRTLMLRGFGLIAAGRWRFEEVRVRRSTSFATGMLFASSAEGVVRISLDTGIL